MPPVPKARKKIYDELMSLQRRRLEVSYAIFEELKREGIGEGQPWHERWRTIEKVQNERMAAWEDASLEIDPPIPQTGLEDLLDQHHRLQGKEWDLCDKIEEQWGAVSPLFDTRPDAVPRRCPY